MRKILFGWFTAVLIIAVGVVTSCSENENIEAVPDNFPIERGTDVFYEEADASSQQAANEIYNDLIESFIKTETRSTGINFTYPDYYGGAYIDNKGDLTVLIKEGVAQTKAAIPNMLNGNNKVNYKICKYSFKELLSIKDLISNYKAEHDDAIESNYFSYYISQENNQIVVELKDDSTEKIEAFREAVTNSPAVTFVKSKGEIILIATDIKAGSKINTDIGAGSVGYRAKTSDGKTGIVTCAHVISNGATLKVNGTAVGTCTKWHYGDKVDAAFCEVTNSSYVPSNTIDSTTTVLSTETAWPGDGTTFNRRGFKTGAKTGTIISNNADYWAKHPVTKEDIHIVEAVKVKVVAAPGDSGGIVYTYVSSKNIRYTVGIMSAISIDPVTKVPTGEGYYIKAPYVNSTLGLSRY